MRLILLFVTQLLNALLLAAPSGYEVKEVTGVVLIWRPFYSHWSPARQNETLREGTLLQIVGGGGVTLSQEGSPSLALQGAQIVRIQDGAFKEFQLSPSFSARISPRESTDSMENAQKFLGSAWRRLVAAVVKRSQPEIPLPEVLDADIEILSPNAGATLFSDTSDFDIPVFWTALQTPADYEIRVGKVGGGSDSVVESTDQLFHTLRWREPGEHYLQITTKDGKHRSKRHRVYLARSLKPQLEKSAEEMDVPNLKLPPDHFTFWVRRFPVEITFEWRSPLSQELEILSVWNRSRKEVVLGNMARVPFTEPGEYSWRVGRSELRKFELISATGGLAILPISTWLKRSEGIFLVGLEEPESP